MTGTEDDKYSVLCQLNGGCMGCCGYDFPSAERIKEAIQKNTLEFEKASPRTEVDLVMFRDRAYPLDLRDSVCRNLIDCHGKLLCPLHPVFIKKEGIKIVSQLNKDSYKNLDLRAGHCDIHYFCKTTKEFAFWDKDKRQRFLSFVAEKKLDNIAYSLKMDQDELLKEFKEVEQQFL